jgi:hypothetical protein
MQDGQFCCLLGRSANFYYCFFGLSQVDALDLSIDGLWQSFD